MMDGKPIYCIGYRDVLYKTKQPEDITGTSSLQWLILSHLASIIYVNILEKGYLVAINEPELHIDKGNNLSGDILMYKSGDLNASDFTIKNADKPAFIQIEVNVTADFSNDSEDNLYVQKKINKLIDFGTQKIIWIFSASKQVLVVTNKEQWNWYDWNTPVALTEGYTFNIGAYLDSKSVVL